ncbi:unnamed protein product, partial [Symbiodinium necroappetens]
VAGLYCGPAAAPSAEAKGDGRGRGCCSGRRADWASADPCGSCCAGLRPRPSEGGLLLGPFCPLRRLGSNCGLEPHARQDRRVHRP